MLTSKQIIEQTGISRATLNNYIALGLLRRPLVQRAKKDDGRAPRIGYFPDDVIERINDIQNLKREGLTMAEICDKFNPGGSTNQSNVIPHNQATDRQQTPPTSYTLEVGLEDIKGPAYMVNNNFELLWWNDASVNTILSSDLHIQSDIGERNALKLLMESELFRDAEGWEEVLSIHLQIAKKRLSANNIHTINASLNHEDSMLLIRLFEDVDEVEQSPILHFPIELKRENGAVDTYVLYACFFREGIFFVYAQSELDNSPLIDFLSQRDHVIRNLLAKRKPFLTSLAVMVADLQNSCQICAELPPNEYFELINHIWQAAEPVFRKYYGTHGKHVGDGMVYYFFPQPDSNYNMNAIRCAQELKTMMREVSRDWQRRKNWLHELHLNIGLHEGQEWFGTYSSATNLEFTVLGDTINHAARISDFARNGAVWVTKSMLENLGPKDRTKLRFGIRRMTHENGQEILIQDTYSRVSSLVDLSEGRNFKFNDIATLPVTEIIDLDA